MKLFNRCTATQASIVRCLLMTVVLLLTIFSLGFAQTFSWQQTNGPEGGPTNSILIQPSGQLFATIYSWGAAVYRSSNSGNSWTLSNAGVNSVSGYLGTLAADLSGRIFMGSAAGIFRSTDNGVNWSYVLGLGNGYVVAVNTSGYIFVGNGFNGQQDGVYRSTDNGVTFQQTNNGLTTTSVISFAFKPGGYVFAGTTVGGVFRSTDNGDSWTEVNSGLGNLDIVSLLATSSGDLFAGTADGLYRSTNNGDNWSLVPLGFALPQTFITALAENLVGDVFVGEQYQGIFRSTDGGTTWVRLNSGLSSLWITCFQVNSSGHIFAGTGAGIYRSTNNGNSWTWINTDIKATHCFAFATHSSGVAYVAAWSAGVFRTTNNGANWTKTSLGDISAIMAVTIDPAGNVYAADHYPYSGMTMFRSSDGGASWAPLPSPIWFFVNVLATNSSGHVFAGNNTSAYRSTDGGATWIEIINGLTNTDIKAFLMRPSGEMFVGTYGGGVFRSTNNGDSWLPSSNGLTATDVICLVRNASGYMFAGTQTGGIFRSTNNGSTWSECNTGFPYLSTLAFATNSVGHIFVSSTYYLYRSTNNGNSWESIGMSGGYVGPIPSLAITTDGYLLVGSNGVGVYRSAESTGPTVAALIIAVQTLVGTGSLTQGEGTSLIAKLDAAVEQMNRGDINAATGQLGAFINQVNALIMSRRLTSAQGQPLIDASNGIISMLQGGLHKDGPLQTELMPESYQLEQNYPNPFNPTTTIRYALPADARVTLEVYDMLGRRVAALVNGQIAVGYHDVSFDASNLASGLYIYRLQAHAGDGKSFVQVRKLMVLK